MSNDPAASLAAQLGGLIPDEIKTLPPDIMQRLAATLADNKEKQLKLLDESIEEMISQLPIMLRKPVRKIMGQ
ncbi:hypothetical protein FOS14_23075 [Skermania sp. ID1734]|uniref:hypothetical protein n=1 Tax=Skermania sp. ID1734 TaxID=2597516 RepID=UPI00118084A3|nr:hypothetical protein [Skermania sp. ID1734]TSD93438.1 hypothetical protein FOS14_23075 [Skermania sp. ID1734]